MNIFKEIIRYAIVKWKTRNKNISFPYSCKISLRTRIEGQNVFNRISYIRGCIGYATYIGSDSVILAKVGRFCSIGSDVKVIIGIHPVTYPYATTCPMFYSLRKQNGAKFTSKQEFEEYAYADGENPVVIGNDVWINSHARIVSGVTIGNGAVLLAGCVVTKDVPPYAIVGGVPAKILKYRYSEEDIAFLEKFQWWNKSPDWLSKNSSCLLNINLLKTLADTD